MICRFVDTHCYFNPLPSSGDEEANLQRAAQADVGKIIVPAIEAENFARMQALAEKYQPLYAVLGLYPGIPERHSGVSLDQLQQTLKRHPTKVVAIEEIGLDPFGDDPQFEGQRWLSDKQLKLAKRYDLSVILHPRRIHDKLTMHPKRYDLSRTGVVHGFSGSLQQAKQFVQLGCRIGIGDTITYPHTSKTRDVVIELPLTSLLLETDASDMPFNGFQGQLNRPEQAAWVFGVSCELRSEPKNEIVEVLLNNTHAVSSVRGQFIFRRQHPAVGV